MKKRNIFWILIGIGVLIVILLMLIGNVISIGDKIAKVNNTLAIVFYVLCGLLIYLLIIHPIFVIAFSPTFKVPTVLEDDKKTRRIYIKVAKNLLRQKTLNENSIINLKNGLKNKDTLKLELNKVYNNDVKKEINKLILKNAKTVMVSTAISQNGKLDMFTVLVVNIKMIKEIVEKCGFRPSYKNLAKLAVNVLGTALISEGLENLDFGELFPNATTGILSEVPFLKTITGSIAQGISNAFLTLRIGVITRKYLFSDTQIKTKAQIKVESFKESAMMIPSVIKSGIMVFPEKIRNIFTKKEKNQKEYEV